MSADVEVEGLSKRYGALLALDGVSLAVERGAVFGLLGPNGAGKSTTFGVLCGWLRATHGTARVLGVDCRALHRLRGRVAALPQDAALPRYVPVRAALEHYARLQGLRAPEARREVARVLELVELADEGGVRGRELSHGMAKRVGLAQALIGRPEVIFLDEPTAGLDPASARHVKDVIARLAPAATVIVSSHNLAEVQEICTHGAVLDRGRVVWSGAMAELTRQRAEVSIVLGGETLAPAEALRAALPEVRLEIAPGRVQLAFPAEHDTAQVIARALRVLLDAGAPVLEVRRGTSLESAFLELVRPGSTSR